MNLKQILIPMVIALAISLPAQSKEIEATTKNSDKNNKVERQIVASSKSLDWLVGTWVREGKSGVIGEQWTKKDSLTLDGFGFMVKGSDTVITERTQLIQCDSGCFFVADVPGNDSKVWFRLTQSDSTGFLFENPTHDFPTKVCYHPIGLDSLEAWIAGPDGKGSNRMLFGYRRVTPSAKK